MPKILIIAECDAAELKPATRHALTAAQAAGGDIDVLTITGDGAAAIAAAARLPGVGRVLTAQAPHYAYGLAEPAADLAASVIKAGGYSHVFMAATSFGKNLAPRLAALLDVAMLSDIIAVIDADTFDRPIYAGNAVATVRAHDPIKLATVRTAAFPAAAGEGGSATVEPVAVAADPGISRFVSAQIAKSERPELTAARVVVSGGRGIGSAENFRVVEALADKLGAAVGASRAAVDAGFAANDLQVGQTGKIVAPELYVALGVSGAIQHLAGMKDSKVIVAINKDEEAPIFQVADYGLVADLFQAAPELTAAL